MTVLAAMDAAVASHLNVDMDLNLELTAVNAEEDVEEVPGNAQLAAPFAPMMEEVHTVTWFISLIKLTHIPYL